jgi:hypothetical protein
MFRLGREETFVGLVLFPPCLYLYEKETVFLVVEAFEFLVVKIHRS